MADNQVEVNAKFEQQMTRFYDYGKSTMIVCVDSTIVGIIAIADTIRVSRSTSRLDFTHHKLWLALVGLGFLGSGK